jgi:hypothetical protein
MPSCSSRTDLIVGRFRCIRALARTVLVLALAPVLPAQAFAAGHGLGGISGALSSAAGEVKVPAAGGAVNAASSAVRPVAKPASSTLQPVTKTASSAVQPVTKTAAPVASAVIKPASSALQPVIKTASSAVQPVIRTASSAVQPVVKTASPVVRPVTGAVAPVVQRVVGGGGLGSRGVAPIGESGAVGSSPRRLPADDGAGVGGAGGAGPSGWGAAGSGSLSRLLAGRGVAGRSLPAWWLGPALPHLSAGAPAAAVGARSGGDAAGPMGAALLVFTVAVLFARRRLLAARSPRLRTPAGLNA